MPVPSVRIFTGLGSLGGETEITSTVTDIRIWRGRRDLLDPIQPGQATLRVKNFDGAFDDGGTLAGDVPINEPLRILAAGTAFNYPVFSGRIQSVQLDYQPGDVAYGTIVAFDGLSQLSKRTLSEHTTAQGPPGDVITSLLTRSEVDWDFSIYPQWINVGVTPQSFYREVATGASTIASTYVPSGTNCLDLMRRITESEVGNLFVRSRGGISFRGRYDVPADASLEFTETTAGGSRTAATFMRLTGTNGASTVANRVVYTSVGQSPQVADDAVSQAAYGVVGYEKTDTLLATEAGTDASAEYLLSVLADPSWRVTSVEVRPLGVSVAGREALLALDIGHKVVVSVNLPSTSVTRTYVVQGIEHTITPGDHVMTVWVSLDIASTANLFQLGTSALGGTDTLGN